MDTLGEAAPSVTASDSLLNFIKKIINIPKVEVVSYHFITDNELLINLENISGNSICPHCGNMSIGYSSISLV